MRAMMLAACAAMGVQSGHAEDLRIDIGAGLADQQGAQAGSSIQLAATWWAHPRLGIEFTLGRGSGHDGGKRTPGSFDFLGDVWVERYAGLGLRHRFAARAGAWQPFVRAGFARVEGTAEWLVRSELIDPLVGVLQSEVQEFEVSVRDTSPYLGFGATRTLGSVEFSVQLQHLAVEFGGRSGHGRTELLFGIGWSL